MRFEKITSFPNVNLPKRATAEAAGYDFECAEYTIVPAHTITLIPTGIKCQIDNGYYLQLALRSSTPKKKGLMLANSVGIIDADLLGREKHRFPNLACEKISAFWKKQGEHGEPIQFLVGGWEEEAYVYNSILYFCVYDKQIIFHNSI